MGPKLLLNDAVEVRQLEEGLRGSWYSGVVVGVSNLCRDVKYDELLCETGGSKLIESIPVTDSVEGFYQRPCVRLNYRGRIRPIPPCSQSCVENQRLSFGVCVDVWYKEAWWEGVIFDYEEGANERHIFFPDESDECSFKLADLRATLEWDEFSSVWKERGVWMLVNLAKEHKKNDHLSQFIKHVWSHLRVHYGFTKMISEWTCGAYSVWKEYFREVVDDLAVRLNPVILTPKGQVIKRNRYKSKSSKGNYLSASVLTRSMRESKEQELSLRVRTRRMCMTDLENPVVSNASQSSILDSAQCQNDQAPCVICGLISESVPVKKGSHHHRILQNDHTQTSPHILHNSVRMPQNSNYRSKGHLGENKITVPRKAKPLKVYNSKLETHSGISSKITRQVDDGLHSQVQDFEIVGRNEKLISQRQSKGGVAMRFPIVRQPRKNRISKRHMPKIRISPRIKRISRNFARRRAKQPRLTLQEDLEAPQSLPKDKGLFDNQNQAPPVASSNQEYKTEHAPSSPKKKRCSRAGKYHDSVCFVCQYGDELLHCDHCMSSYHLNCIDLKVPEGEPFCPCCRCGLCGLNYSSNDAPLFTQPCYQCGRQFHVDCLNKAGISVLEDSFADKFCSKSCFEICARLHKLLQMSVPTTMEGFTWTITRSRRNDCNVHNQRVHPLVQVSQVLNVFHECFEPIHEPHTGRDLVADIVYNSVSKLRRLDFHGFYVMALVNGEEVVCVATIRIFGQKVAEMPLIATRFKYRRQGMCRLLVDELEKMLVEMGVERLVLPAIAQLSNTWVSSFGFMEIPDSIREELLAYPFVFFQGTTMFQKILSRSFPPDSSQSPPQLKTAASPVQEIEVGNDWGEKRFNLRCKRMQKPKAPDKGKNAMDGLDKSLSTNKFVYKRRRIQASRDAFDDL